ncbi:MAG TPA: MG2 domain-containing protein [bacterium]|nr:MG2 domain-containing protein [bacterium]
MRKNKLRMFLIAVAALAVAFFPGHLQSRQAETLYISIQGDFEPGEEMRGDLSGNVSSAELALYKIDIYEALEKSDGSGWADNSEFKLKKAELVRKWTVQLRGKGERNEWRSAEISMDNPGPGAYALQATGGAAASYKLLIVSDIAMLVRWDNEKAIVFVADRRTGAAASGAAASAFIDGKWVRRVCDANGMTVFEAPGSGSIPVVAEKSGSFAASNFYSYGESPYEKQKVYIYTDRPVYRPGQKVNIKGVARVRDGDEYSLPTAGSARVFIDDPRGNKVFDEEVGFSEFGTFSAAYSPKGGAPLGHYSIRVEFAGVVQYHHFMVEEYRKPEHEITVVAARDRIVRGEPLEFSIKANYYFGEPVKNAEVSYEILRTSIWDVGILRGAESEYRWYYDQDRGGPRWHWGYRGEQVASGGGTTDENGAMEVVFADTNAEQDMEYTLIARVTEAGRREAQGEGSARVYRGEYKLSVRADRYMAKPGEKAKVIVGAIDLFGAPVSRKVDVGIELVSWEDGARSVKNVSQTQVETSSATGEASIEFTPDEPGYYEITASGKSAAGFLFSETAGLYVSDRGGRYRWGASRDIEIILDKDSYADGEEATALIISSAGDADALATLEAEGIIDSKALKFENGAAHYSFKVGPEHKPNVYLTVSAFRDNNLLTQTRNIVCPPTEKFLDLKIISDKAVYKPGERARVTVEARDRDGNPAPAELSIGVVDESIYAVRPDDTTDIREFFYGRRYSRVGMASSLWFMGGGRGMVADMAAPAAAPQAEGILAFSGRAMNKAAADGQFAPAQIRSYFPDTAHWAAHLITDEEGRATAEFMMPDSLTSWRVATRAATTQTAVGQTTSDVSTRKNLMVRLRTPRFFTQGDKLRVTALIDNYLDADKEVLAVLNATGLRLLEKNEKTVRVKAGGNALVEWSAVVETPGSAWVTAKALTDEESDAMQLTIPVLPRGARGGETAAGEAGARAALSLKLPQNRVAGTESLKIKLAPSLTGGMFAAFEYLADYPYGCVEQTMSRFLPNAVMAEALQKAGKPLTGKLKELPDMAAKGYERLADMQNEDGSWGWWKGDERNAMITAYVVFGLARAARADFTPPEGMLPRGAAALENMFGALKDPDEKAYVLFALAQAGYAEGERGTIHMNNGMDRAGEAKKLYSSREKLTHYGKALLGIACSELGLKDEAIKIAGELAKSADVTASAASWKTKTDRYRWTDNAVETAAFALMAILEADAKNPVASKAANFINMSRMGDGWRSTRDTAAALLALTKYMEKRESGGTDFSYVVTVNGVEAGKGEMTAADIDGEGVVIDASRLAAPGNNKIVIEKSGEGNLYYNAALNYYEAADFLKSKDNGIKVERWYSWDAEGKKKLGVSTRLRTGDRIWSHVRIRPRAAFDYVMVENYLPSGFEVDRDERGFPGYYYWTNREIRDDRVVAFLTRMWDREYVMSVSMRAETPGDVTAMPCAAELMYFPEVNGRSSEAKFIIEE